MKDERPDVLEILEEDKKWHQKKINRINLAISILKGEKVLDKSKSKETSPQSGIQWASEIDKLYEKYPNEIFTVNDVCDKLAKEGIPEALEESGRNVINVALARKVKQGKLIRQGPGLYRKKFNRAFEIIEKADGSMTE